MALRQEHQIEPEFDHFVRSNARPLLAYCLRRAAHADAHDATAEVLSIAWRKRDELPDGDQGLYWLFGVARRVLANQRRSQQRRRQLARRAGAIGMAPVADVDSQVVRHERDREVVNAVAALGERDQEILALIVWDEVPRAEVATMLDISEQAVHKRYQRALKRLEGRLDDPGGAS